MIDENDIERIYSQQLHTELINETKATATKLIELYPNYFGLSNLINNFEQQPIHESITQAMRNTHFAYIDNDINFDHALVITMISTYCVLIKPTVSTGLGASLETIIII